MVIIVNDVFRHVIVDAPDLFVVRQAIQSQVIQQVLHGLVHLILMLRLVIIGHVIGHTAALAGTAAGCAPAGVVPCQVVALRGHAGMVKNIVEQSRCRGVQIGVFLDIDGELLHPVLHVVPDLLDRFVPGNIYRSTGLGGIGFHRHFPLQFLLVQDAGISWIDLQGGNFLLSEAVRCICPHDLGHHGQHQAKGHKHADQSFHDFFLLVCFVFPVYTTPPAFVHMDVWNPPIFRLDRGFNGIYNRK